MSQFFEQFSDFDGDPDFDKLIVGRRIVASTYDTLTLDDGTVLEVEDASDCCAWWSGEITDVVVGDAIITGTEEVIDLSPYDPDATDRFMIRILSRDKAIAAIDIEGNPGSGCYCSSVTLCVRREEDGDGSR